MPNYKEQPNFLLIAPPDFDLYQLIEKNLAFLGYRVTVIHQRGYIFKYKNIWQRLTNMFKKLVLVDYNYKRRLKEDFVLNKQLELLNQVEHYDRALVIRADFFSTEFLMTARKKTNQFVAFHYDGMDRDRRIFNKIYLFDRFYAFDPSDVKAYARFHLHYAPNFYFDYPEAEQLTQPSADPGYAIHYISSFHPSRMAQIIDFHKFIEEHIDNIRFDLIYHHTSEKLIPVYARQHFNCSEQIIPFKQQTLASQQADIILDFCIDEHKGLSFRIFEGLKYGKKVITTNEMILHQDFYHPHNFFLLKEGNYEELLAFLRLPYQAPKASIYAKYAFCNWLNNVFDFKRVPYEQELPLVSIIIPTYNNERVIVEAVQSALSQRYSNIEVIIVDDGSTDNSYNTLQTFIQHKPNLQLIHQDNAGPSAARNKGFSHARGQYLVFLDGDDRLHKDYVSECVRVFKKMPNLNIVYTAAEVFENDKGVWYTEPYSLENLLVNNSIPIYAMIRASVFAEVGQFDTSLQYAEDWELWIRILQKYEGVYNIPTPLYYYRRRKEKNSLTDHRNKHKTHNSYYEYIYEKHRDFYAQHGLTLRSLLAAAKIVRNGRYNDKYKNKYYNEWYRKAFYYLFKRSKFREIYLDSSL